MTELEQRQPSATGGDVVSVVAGWAAADFDAGLGQAHGENDRRG